MSADLGKESSIIIGKLSAFMISICVIILMSFLTLWLLAGQWVAPTRRALQDYHQDWLNYPHQHGITIQAFSCLQGQVPCLLVEPDAAVGAAKRGRLLRQQLHERGQQLADYGEIKGILVLLHGRKSRKEDLLPIAERFAAAGLRCLLPDLPAHGDSPLTTLQFATSTFESHLAAKVLADARQHFQLPDEPAFLWGMSMGGAFAIKAAITTPARWQAMVIVSSFDNLAGVVDDQLARWPIPFITTLQHHVEQLAVMRGGVEAHAVQPAIWATQVNVPVLVAHGDQDELVALQRGKRLFDAFASPKKHWVEVEGGNHHRVLTTDMPLYAMMAAWFLSAVQ